MIVHQSLGITHKQRFNKIRPTSLLVVMLVMELRGVGLQEIIELVDLISCQGALSTIRGCSRLPRSVDKETSIIVTGPLPTTVCYIRRGAICISVYQGVSFAT